MTIALWDSLSIPLLERRHKHSLQHEAKIKDSKLADNDLQENLHTLALLHRESKKMQYKPYMHQSTLFGCLSISVQAALPRSAFTHLAPSRLCMTLPAKKSWSTRPLLWMWARPEATPWKPTISSLISNLYGSQHCSQPLTVLEHKRLQHENIAPAQVD